MAEGHRMIDVMVIVKAAGRVVGLVESLPPDQRRATEAVDRWGRVWRIDSRSLTHGWTLIEFRLAAGG